MVYLDEVEIGDLLDFKFQEVTQYGKTMKMGKNAKVVSKSRYGVMVDYIHHGNGKPARDQITAWEVYDANWKPTGRQTLGDKNGEEVTFTKQT